MPQTITESTWGDPDGRMQVDREAGVIRGVKCLGKQSKNGRVYTDQALEDARGFYEGVSVNIDHPAPGAAHLERGIADGFGVLQSVRILKEGVFADLHYLKEHQYAAVITERAERFPRNFGLSHNATGQVREAPDGSLIVEGLHSVESVDIVSRPATNAGLFESEDCDVFKRKNQEPDKTKTTVAAVLENAKGDKNATRLLSLLEQDAYAAMGKAPLEITEGESTDAQVKAALREMVSAVAGDKTLDTQATFSRIGEIMQTKESATGKAKADDNAAAPAADAIESIQAKLDSMERREALRDLLEDRNLRRSDLNESQRKAIDRCETEDEMAELLETFHIQPPNRQRPNIGSRRLQESDGASLLSGKDLQEEMRRARGIASA